MFVSLKTKRVALHAVRVTTRIAVDVMLFGLARSQGTYDLFVTMNPLYIIHTYILHRRMLRIGVAGFPHRTFPDVVTRRGRRR